MKITNSHIKRKKSTGIPAKTRVFWSQGSSIYNKAKLFGGTYKGFVMETPNGKIIHLTDKQAKELYDQREK